MNVSSTGPAGPLARTTLIDGTGADACAGVDGVGDSECVLTGVAPWIALVSDYAGRQLDFAIKVSRLNNPAGCTPLADVQVFGFDGPAVLGAISAQEEVDCFTFTKWLGSDPTPYLSKVGASGGALQATARVYSASGTLMCTSTISLSQLDTCDLIGVGQYTVVIRDSQRRESGSYALSLKRLDGSDGCVDLPTTSIGAQPVAASVSSAGEVDCYEVDDFNEFGRAMVGFRASKSTATWMLVDAQGQMVCRDRVTTHCSVGAGSNWRLVVFDPAADVFSYRLSVRRTTNPTGCTQLLLPASSAYSGPIEAGTIEQELGADCFTFTRPAGEPDSNYRFRATNLTGDLAPRFSLIDSSGTVLCEGSDAQCWLSSSNQYMVLVEDGQYWRTGEYQFSLRKDSNPTGCTALDGVGFDDPSTLGTVSAAGEVDCFSIPEATTGQLFSMRFADLAGANRSPVWTVVDGNGATICRSNYPNPGTCTLFGAPGWHVMVADQGNATFSYRIAMRRITEAEGCVVASFGFGGPQVVTDATDPTAASCMTFTRGLEDAAERYWIRSARTSGNSNPSWAMYNDLGTRICPNSTLGFDDGCLVGSSGKFTVVSIGATLGATSGIHGSFSTAVRKTASPTGCTALPVTEEGISLVGATLATPGDVDCYQFDAVAGDQFNFTKSAFVDGFSIVNPNGTQLCVYWQSPCTIPTSGKYSIVAFVTSATTTGGYQFKGQCLNEPCGQSATAITKASPLEVGAATQVTIALRGFDLQKLQGVAISKGGDSIDGLLGEPSSDGRTVDVRFNLSGAAFGDWTLEGSFSDGTSRVLDEHVAVGPIRSPEIDVDVAGRPAFRVGQPNAIKVVVSNSGNVDAIGVPVVLHGIPQGSVVTPVTPVYAPSGSAVAPNIQPVQIDPSTAFSTQNGSQSMPLFVGSVAPGASSTLELNIAVPGAGSYAMEASAAECFGENTSIEQLEQDCMLETVEATVDVVAGLASDVVPGTSCFSTGASISMTVLNNMSANRDWFTGGDLLSWGIGAADCATDFVPVGTVAKSAVNVISAASSAAGAFDALQACMKAASAMSLQQTAVTSIDPNDIVGPAGTGANHYIDGDGPLDYRVLFENLESASAPAQRIRVSNQLDPSKFDLTSVVFKQFKFGSTTLTLDFPEAHVNETVDMRPALNLLVRITADVSESGLVSVELQALDPATLLPPDDPFAGILPPNVIKPEGEGHFDYAVNAKQLPSATAITNQASIVFDDNEAIETPTWSNIIDRLTPSGTIGVSPGSGTSKAMVSWTGSDDASGVNRFDIYVSKNGGEYQLWWSVDSPGSTVFTSTEVASYRFRATLRDGAGNIGQTSSTAIALRPDDPPAVDPAPPALVVAAPTINGEISRILKIAVKRSRNLPGVTCPRTAVCTATVDLWAMVGRKRTKFGSTKLTLAAGATGKPTIKLSSKSFALLKKRKKLKATLVYSATAGTQTATKTFTTTLVPAKR